MHTGLWIETCQLWQLCEVHAHLLVTTLQLINIQQDRVHPVILVIIRHFINDLEETAATWRHQGSAFGVLFILLKHNHIFCSRLAPYKCVFTFISLFLFLLLQFSHTFSCFLLGSPSLLHLAPLLPPFLFVWLCTSCSLVPVSGSADQAGAHYVLNTQPV